MDLSKPLIKWSSKAISIFFLVLGLIALTVGCYLGFFKGNGYVETTATIESIDPIETATDEEQNYEVTVRYTVDGTEYTAKLGEYKPSFAVGQEVKIKYDPAHPEKIVSASKTFAFILIAVGAVVVAVVVFVFVKNGKQKKKYAGMKDTVAFEPSNPGSTERKLYFVTDLGTAKGTCRIEDENRRVLYEAVSRKYSLVADSEMEFVDRVKDRRTTHYIGKVATSSSSTIWVIDNHSTFTVDGRDVWKILHENGITIKTGLKGVFWNYTILRDGVEIAYAENTGKYVHEEDEEKHGVLSKTPAQGFYRIRTTEQNCDAIFLTLFAIGRTDMAFYH